MSDYLDLALEVWESRHDLTYTDMVKKLSVFQNSPFSARQLASITGLSSSTVSRNISRHGKTGGRLNPATLRDISESRVVLDPEVVRSIVDRGTSIGTFAWLSGRSEYQIRKAYRA